MGGMTPLHVAARRRCLPLCRLLISEKALVDAASDQDRWTPLHAAVAARDVGCTQALLVARADPHCQDKGGRTPMQMAIRSGEEAVREALAAHMDDDSDMIRCTD